ncbi:hypothetical protein BVRB_9g212350 [Beta vulgaris subsp. vulgaris]|nr:hypothetical protein BVRB_9g212350 [Beta vulgaris subsp. vulgaris]
MSSSKSKRAPAYSSDESTNSVSDDSIERELEESSKYLPSGKKLTEGRKYIFVKKQTEMSDGDKDDEKHGDVNLREVRKALIYMIIVDGLSFQHVMKSGFRHFISVVCPGFLIPSGLSLARDCYRLYLSEKSKLKEQLHNSCQRICVTTDTWTSIQDKNYLSVTAHFIDNDWELHEKIINFCPMFTQQGEAIGKGIKECLESWGLEDKLFTVTVDNASYNDFACTDLRKMAQQTGCVSDGKYLQIRCIAHVINVIVSDAIEENGLCIERVRHAVKFVKVSTARKRRFKDLAQKFNVESKCYLCLDDPTNWNSTYMMLETAMKFQRVFSALNLPDEMGVSLNERPPDAHDWKKIERLVVFLEGFYLFTRRISNSLYVTSNKGLYEIMALNNILKKWVQNVDLDFQAMAISMKQKYDKYWGNVEKMNMLIYIAVIHIPS